MNNSPTVKAGENWEFIAFTDSDFVSWEEKRISRSGRLWRVWALCKLVGGAVVLRKLPLDASGTGCSDSDWPQAFQLGLHDSGTVWSLCSPRLICLTSTTVWECMVWWVQWARSVRGQGLRRARRGSISLLSHRQGRQEVDSSSSSLNNKLRCSVCVCFVWTVQQDKHGTLCPKGEDEFTASSSFRSKHLFSIEPKVFLSSCSGETSNSFLCLLAQATTWRVLLWTDF